MGRPQFYAQQSVDEARASLPEVGTGYVFVIGEGFVPVDRSAPVVVAPRPTDWEAVAAANREVPQPVPPPFVPAESPVIDPAFEPRRTEGEAAPGDTVAEDEVSFWEDVGSIFTTSAPVLAQNWFETGNVWGRQEPVVIPQRPMVPLPQGINLMGTPARATPVQSIARPIVQDQQLCAIPATNPRYLRYNCQTGEYSKVPRRRRRRLLTSSDLKDLAALKAIVGGGAKMDGAVVAAVRR